MTQVLAWALYDLANTFFAVAMLSFYFPMWVTEELHAKELSFSLALGISMACVALLMPVCGAVSDVTGLRMRFLRWTTYGCAVITGCITFTPHLIPALILFGIANVCYQLGTVFYDALLWQVAPPGKLGHTSGFGAAFGYLGSMAGLILLWPFAHAGGSRAAFLPSAVFFLLFALPSFLLIRDQPSTTRIEWDRFLRTAMVRLGMTLRSARSLTGLWRYLWAAFFSACATNTILTFMAVYTRKVLGFTQDEVVRFFVFSQMFCVAGSFTLSRLIPRIGARRTLMGIWGGWIAALALVTVNLSRQWMWVAGPAIGFCLGATWATSRVLIMELSPKEQLAEMLGLAGLVTRLASIVGPLIWGVIVWDPSRYQQAVLVQIGLLGIGVWMLSGVRQVVE